MWSSGEITGYTIHQLAQFGLLTIFNWKTCSILVRSILCNRDALIVGWQKLPIKYHTATTCKQNILQDCSLLGTCHFQPVEQRKKFECNICLQTFTRKTNLNHHLQVAHDQELEQHPWRFRCPCCEVSPFRTLTQLISHSNEHHDIEFGM